MNGCEIKVADALNHGVTTSVVASATGATCPSSSTSRASATAAFTDRGRERLPAVFAQETILAARSAIVEKPFKVARAAASVSATAGIDFAKRRRWRATSSRLPSRARASS